MNFGLKNTILQSIKDVFSIFDTVDEAILYGSRALGTYKNTSDIDITLKGNSLNLTILNKINWQLDDLLLPYTIDLSIYEKINNEDLIEHINRVGKTIYKK